MPSRSGDRTLAALLVLAIPFYLNDFTNIWVTDWRLWLAIDYIVMKMLPCLIVYGIVRNGWCRWDEIGFRRQSPVLFAVIFTVAALVGTVLDQNGKYLLEQMPGYEALGVIPPIQSVLWDRIDLSAGLLMVGVVEETVFRGFMYHVLRRYMSDTAVVALSSVLFGLIHWSAGLHAVIVAMAIGGVFMSLYLAGRSVWPLILAHFFVNLVDYAGIIPKALFRYFY